MDAALALAGLVMGVASSPHCAAMCGAPCAALTRGCKRSAAGFHAGRLLGYMSAGAVAASSVALLGTWSQAAPALRPLWAALHLGFLALGLWWLATGRQPAWMKRGGAVPAPVSVHWLGRHRRPLRSAATGLAWVAWPCGALQAGLLLSALANSAQGGAFVMAGFALGSAPALAAAPWVWARWQALGGGTASPYPVATLGFRVAGAGLALASGWALSHGLWERFAAWCLA
jgi:uncharacterized protein